MQEVMDSASWIAIVAIGVTLFLYIVTVAVGYGKLRARDSIRADSINDIRETHATDMTAIRDDSRREIGAIRKEILNQNKMFEIAQQRLWDTRASRDDFGNLSKKLDGAIEVLGAIKVAVGSLQQAFTDSNRRHDQAEEWRSSHEKIHQYKK